MKKLFLLSILYCLYFFGYSQTLFIKDLETNQPLEAVTLYSEKTKAFALTNIHGQADISNFKNAEKIEIRVSGYKKEIRSFAELQNLGFILGLSYSSISMDEIVVSATKWNQNSRDAPEKISAITSKEVALQNPQTAADLLGISGKIFIQKSQQGGGSPMIRGFSTNRLLYVVDGVRMNTAIFRSGNLQNVISLDPFAIEKTEVLFGPGSVIYGSDAIGGVMSFQTIRPQLALDEKGLVSGNLVTRYSSANNEKTGHFHLNIGWKKWAAVSSFTTHHFGDLRMGSKGPAEYLRPFYVQRIDSVDRIITNDDPRTQRPSGYSQINMMQKIQYKPNEHWDFQYGLHYSETSEYSRYDRHIRYRKGLPRYGEWYYGPQKWLMNNLSITHTSASLLYDQMTFRVAHQFFEESRIDRDLNNNNRHLRTERVNAYSANLDFNKSIGLKNKLYYGFEFVHNRVQSSGVDEDISTGIKKTGPSRYPQADWNSIAAYVNDQYKISNKILLQGGLRYNQYQLDAAFDTSFYPFPFTEANINQGALTGSLGVAFRPTEKWVLSANASTGFRSPNVDDAGKVFDSSPGIVIIPNPNLKAEYAYNGELGIAKVFGEFLKIDLTAYYTILQDAMVRRFATLNGQDSIVYDGTLSRVEAIQNAATATVYGVQAGLEVKLASRFRLFSDINYQIGEEETDNGTKSPLRHAPPTYGVSKLSYTSQNLSVQLYAIYSGKRKFEDLPLEEQTKPEIYAIDKNGKPWSPGWYTLNFKSMYRINENFSVSAGLENITDQRYRPYSSGIVAPGRNVVMSLKASF
ncbi:MAG: TonB-dependent receptor [Saprospiraceae bacterium]|nr:TonB-dependent receptor [Saprospiraceae bacterium]MBP6522359.1 TonB-dependent receptor [Saprospiraceae bacterium]